MIMLLLILWLAIGTPLGAAAWLLGGPLVAWAAVFSSFLVVLLLLRLSFPLFARDLRPEPLEEDLERRILRIWSRSGPERVTAVFLIFPSTTSEFRVWVHSPKRISFFLSRGFVEQMTDHSLHAAFRRIAGSSFRELMAENRREALRSLLERWKGDHRRFRYWFLTFWLHPLERLLGIARI